ncbi:MAG: translation initiation factor [Bacteroides sp.]|nr:translation initiation factor [Bacteroides sp.]MCM1379028.1 translation initiation factor [Bacteroides sp.]MCM1445644.1 translation initiation factor [Prevotella sp.]
MANDWQDALKSLMDGNTLPEGQSPEPETKRPTPKSNLAIALERKGRAGKVATIISGFGADDDIQQVAATLKSRLGTGGSARGGEILIQGDRRDDVRRLLTQLGYK